MIDLDNIRKMFSEHMAANPSGRWRMDSSLAHIVTYAYEQGIKDGQQNKAFELLKNLTRAMDCTFISTWQSTSGWDKELAAAIEYIEEVEYNG